MAEVKEAVEERSGEEIAAEVYAEMDKEAGQGEVKDPKGEGSTPKKDEKEAGETDDKADDQGEDTKETGDGDDANEEEAGDKSEDAGTDDKGSDDLDKKITEYAEKHKLTYAEAKEDIEKTEEIIKQYKNDPAEMARAMRNKDREYSKLRSEAEKAKKTKEPVFKRMSEDQFRQWAKSDPLKEGSETREKMVAGYREKFPARSEAMSDEAIVEEIVERELMIYNEKAGQKEREIKDTASAKRAEIIQSISDADKRFIPEIKALLQETDDATVIGEGFNIQDALYWAKGKAYDADIKAAEERAMKRLKEQPEILGAKGAGNSKPTSSKGVSLNKRQQDIAKAMFGADYEDAKCFEMFKDMYKEEIKKNPNFDPDKD